MKQSNQFILNHLTPKQSQKTYGIANQILLASSKQPFFANISEIIPDNPIPNRFCDINDLFKSQICFFTNIYGLEKTQILQQILENQFFIIIRYLDKQIIFPFNQGKLQLIPQNNNQNKKNKKPEKIENPLEHFINLLKQVRKEYKEQMDLLGKINSFKHPAFINYEFVFPNYTPKNIETPFVTNRVDPNIFEFASYHYFENDPSQILELHITQLVVSLQKSKSSQVLYYNDQSILPVCGDEEDIIFFKTDLKPFKRLLNYKEKFYKIVNELNGKLLNVHQYLSPKRIENGQQYLVRGDYVYHHYMQDGFNDKGWGCAYRSFMSVLSWIIENGYSKRLNIPNHQQIQKLLVEMGDKPIEFVNSSEWIGAFEVNMLINKLTNIECKILNIQKGSDILGKLNEFKQYFIQQGAPIMFGGGLYAYTLLGIDYNEQDCRFLILDPHYVGNDNIKSIIEKGGVQWRKADMFSDENFYNFCMPLVE